MRKSLRDPGPGLEEKNNAITLGFRESITLGNRLLSGATFVFSSERTLEGGKGKKGHSLLLPELRMDFRLRPWVCHSSC